MIVIKDFTNLLDFIKTNNEFSFNQLQEMVYLFHYRNFKTPLFLTSTNKPELIKEIEIINIIYKENKIVPIFIKNSLNLI